MKKLGLIGGAVALLLIGIFLWALSGASDNKAPTELQTIDVSPNP